MRIKTFTRNTMALMFLFFNIGIAFSQIPLGIQGTNQTVCSGTEVTLFAIGGTANRLWQPGGQTGQFITVSPTQTTTYTLTSGNASDTYTVTVCSDAVCEENPISDFNPFLLSTGNNGLTTTRPGGSIDLNWQVSTVSADGPYNPAIVATGIPGNYSRSSWPNTQWVGTNGNLNTTNAFYFFRVQFNMTAAEAQDAVINMQFMADNQVTAVFVNGQLVPNSATPPAAGNVGFQIQNAVSVAMQGNWVEGVNSIVVRVIDQGGFAGFIGQLNPIASIPLPSPIIIDPGIACIADPVQLTANIMNGVWTASCSDCISASGLFNPSKAGVGQHTIFYSKNCQTASIILNVCAPPCSVKAGADVEICQGSSVRLSVKASCDSSVATCVPEVGSVLCDAGCTRAISGSGNEFVNNGETVCITSQTTFNGGINMNGGTLIICGDAKPSYFNINNGDVIVNGSLDVSTVNMNSSLSSLKNYGVLKLQNCGFNGTVENHNVMTVANDFNINSSGKFVNTGTLTVSGSVNNNNTCVNKGTLDVATDLRNNGNGSFENICTINIAKHFHVNSTFANSGKITVGQTSYLNSSILKLNDGSSLVTKDIFVNNTVDGPPSGCSLLKVNDHTTINGSGLVKGFVSYCDANGVEVNNGSLTSGAAFDCVCSPGEPGNTSSDKIAYSWTPATGLSNSNVSNPLASPSVTTTYTVNVTDVATGLVIAKDDVTVSVAACAFPNANSGCVNNVCTLISCKPGFVDENQDPSDGCEKAIEVVSSIEVSPNPFIGGTMLRIPNDLPGVYSAQVIITDLLGNVVYRNDYFPVNASVSVGWELASSKTYIVKVVKGGEASSTLIFKL